MFCFGSGVSVAVRMELVLHEHEVPELEEPLAARATRLAVGVAAAGGFAPVVVDLGVRPARSRPADGPEVLGRRQRRDPLRRDSDLLPEVDRNLVGAELQLRVAGVDAHPDPLPVELEAVADELGRELDRPVLEVLAEREVPQHLEEGQVIRVEPDLVDVRRAEALLRGRRQLAPAAARGRGSRASAAACLRSSTASSGRPRAGRATPTGGADGPSPRRRRESPRGSRSRCAPSGHCTERDSTSLRRRIALCLPVVGSATGIACAGSRRSASPCCSPGSVVRGWASTRRRLRSRRPRRRRDRRGSSSSRRSPSPSPLRRSGCSPAARCSTTRSRRRCSHPPRSSSTGRRDVCSGRAMRTSGGRSPRRRRS